MKPLIAVDVETFDPNLKDKGDGSCRSRSKLDDDGSRLLCVGTYDGSEARVYIPNTAGWKMNHVIKCSIMQYMTFHGSYVAMM